MVVDCSGISRQLSLGPAVALEFFAFWQHLQFSCWDPCVQQSPRQEGTHVGSPQKTWLTPPPTEMYKHVHALLMAVCLAEGRLQNPFWNYAPWKPPEEWWALARKVILQRCCCERNRSVEKIQLKCLRYLFCPFITQACPPSLDCEVKGTCVGGSAI